jgi:iron complex transport system substrate-binding protein
MDKKRIVIAFVLLIAILTVIAISLSGEQNTGFVSDSQIIDMVGRTVDAPKNIERIASISSSSTVLIFMFAPDTLVGWDSRRTDIKNKYMDDKYGTLPYIGGGKGDANFENYISLNPDIVFVGHGGSAEEVNNLQIKLGNIPLVDIEGDNNISTIKEPIIFMGNVLRQENKSNDLINFYDEMVNTVENNVKDINPKDKKRVYFAKDDTGLSSHPQGSQHTQLIEICGGDNVFKTDITKGSAGITIEQIIKWDPDIIIANDPLFYNRVYSDPLWKDIKAVKEKQVYLSPQSPFSWFTGPPGANVIIGIPWTAKILYPERFQDLDLNNITKKFYSEFYHYNLTDEDVKDILESSGLKDY